MDFSLRSADPMRDAEAMARLLSFAESEPVTAEIVRDRQCKFPPDAIQVRLLAEDASGNDVGLASAWRFPYQQPGHFELEIVVEPARRAQGIGTALYNQIVEMLQKQEPTALRAGVRDDCPACLAFAERRGFQVESHQFEAVLDLTAFDPASFAGSVEAAKAAGVRFFSLADTDGSETMLRRLYALNTTVGMDIPGNSGEPARPFEQFAQDVFGGYWFRPEGQIVAAQGEEWVGMAAVGEIAPGVLYNMVTGVLRDYRGRGIAQALKLLAIEYGRRQGAHSIRTNNDSRNAPMLAINRKLGYRPEPGWYRLLLTTAH